MEYQTVTRECVALFVHMSPAPEPEDAASMIRRALEQRGMETWPRMEIDLFPSGPDTLIVARPAAEVIVTVAEYVRPFLPKN